ncbi:hypothetical protein GCM10022228_19490 [Halomonas cibimaris]|uniref:SCP2 domain-containing protein n=1 Tax=Halomonas cibimaris TaxID=657012 RepID=A0ABP7LWF5_9GAMM
MPSPTPLEKMHARFDPEAARAMHEVFQFHFTDLGDYYLRIDDGTLAVEAGEHDDPSVSLSLSSDTLKRLMRGEISGMSAFMSGQLKATGNVMLATRLSRLFPGK